MVMCTLEDVPEGRTIPKGRGSGLSANKRTVETYTNAFRTGDRQTILDCLTDDVVWRMPGVYRRVGKGAFESEIENEGFVGRPDISVSRLIEENNVVVAEGTVTHERVEGAALEGSFCDVFDMHDAKIRQLTSYLMLGSGDRESE
jgi:ketosteroid isomerase-like protein